MPTQGFTVRVGNSEADIERVEVQGSSVSLDLAESDYVEYGEEVAVSYSPPSTGKLQDALGNTVDSFPLNEVDVRNDVLDPNETDPPEPISASVTEDGSIVRVVFNEPLQFDLVPPGQVANLRETARGIDSITWSWIAPTEIVNISGPTAWYEWRVRQVGGAWSTRRRINSATVEVTGRSASVSYEIEVRAGNAAGAGPTAVDTATTGDAFTDLYVVSPGPQRIHRMAGGYGNSFINFISGPDGETAMRDIAFNPTGDMFCVGGRLHKIYRMAGGYGNSWDAGIDFPNNETALRGLAFDSAGDMYALGATRNRIYRMAGGYGNSWDDGIAPASTSFPYGLAFDPDDDLYHSDITTDRIYRMAGGYGNSWDGGILDPSTASQIRYIEFDSDGDLYARGSSRHRIWRMAGGYGNSWDTGEAIGSSINNFGGMAFGPAP